MQVGPVAAVDSWLQWAVGRDPHPFCGVKKMVQGPGSGMGGAKGGPKRVGGPWVLLSPPPSTNRTPGLRSPDFRMPLNSVPTARRSFCGGEGDLAPSGQGRGHWPGTHLEITEGGGRELDGLVPPAGVWMSTACSRSPADEQSPTSNYSPCGSNPTPLFPNNGQWWGSRSGEEGAERLTPLLN